MVETIKNFLPLLGVALGWVLSQLTEKIKAGREDKRKLKRTLFYLLEVRHQLSFYVDSDEAIGQYLTLIKNKYQHIESLKSLDDPQVKSILSSFLKQLVKEKPLITIEEMENLNLNYTKCIDNLSEVDPILAFRLHGKQNIQRLLKELWDRSRISISEIASNISDIGEVDKAFQIIEPNLLKQTLLDLNETLIDISRKINHRTYKQTKNRIAFQKSKDDLADMEKALENLLKGFPGLS